MEKENMEIWIRGIAFILGSVCIGILLERKLLKGILNLSSKTKWKIDDILFTSLRGLLLFWCALAGLYLASNELIGPLLPDIVRKILVSGIILSLSLFIARITAGFIKVKSGVFTSANPGTSIVTNIVRITIFIIGSIIVLQSIGISVAPILTALGVGGLAVALALQDTLSNLFSGIQIVASRQIRKEDYIRLSSGEEGFVQDISWKNTSIRMLSNNLIIVPNSKLSSTIVTNYNLPDKEIAVLLEIGVSYDSNLGHVEQITMQTAREVLEKTNGGVNSFEPFIRYHSFADSSIGFTVILRANEFSSQYLIKHEFIKALHKKYKENRIEIPFPIRKVLLSQKISRE